MEKAQSKFRVLLVLTSILVFTLIFSIYLNFINRANLQSIRDENSDVISTLQSDLSDSYLIITQTTNEIEQLNLINQELESNLKEVNSDLGDFKISWEEAKDNIYHFKFVCGPIANINSSSYPIFIDIGNSYPVSNRFSIVTWDEKVIRIIKKSINRLDKLDICVLGEISMYKDVPQIIVNDVTQIPLLEYIYFTYYADFAEYYEQYESFN